MRADQGGQADFSEVRAFGTRVSRFGGKAAAEEFEARERTSVETTRKEVWEVGNLVGS